VGVNNREQIQAIIEGGAGNQLSQSRLARPWRTLWPNAYGSLARWRAAVRRVAAGV